MLMLPNGVRVFVANEAINMKKSFDGLASLVQTSFPSKPMSGHLFVFFNRKRDKVKLLYWDRNGFALWYKRLAQGRYRLPTIQKKIYTLSILELNFLLEGIDLTHRNRLSVM